MSSSLEKRIIKDFKLLNREERKEILTKLFSISDFVECKGESEITCPHCNSPHFWKNGKVKDRQRYLCKKCGKSFNILTNTPISYTKKDMSLWLDYCEELINQTSLRKCAKKLDIALSTAFFWRHKLLDAIRENKPQNMLKDEVKVIPMYFRESFKGNHTRSEFEMPRKAYKHKFSWHQECLGIPKRVCVLVAQDSTDLTVANACCIGRPSKEDMLKVYKSTLKENTTIIKPANTSDKEYNLSLFVNSKEFSLGSTNESYNTDKIYDFKWEMSYFIKIYRGVSSKYLQNYIDLFVNLQSQFVDCPLYLKGKIPFRNTNFKGRPPIFT